MKSSIEDVVAIILVGGLGTRLRTVIDDLPKPMASIDGEPFLTYQLAILRDAGIKKVVFASGYMADVIESYFGSSWNEISLQYSREDEPLGTGGAIINATKKFGLNATTIVMNGDTFFPVNFEGMLLYHLDKRADVTIAMFESAEDTRYSMFKVDSSGLIIWKGSAHGEFYSGGIYLFSSQMMKDLGDMTVKPLSFEADLTPEFFRLGRRVFAYVASCPFIDIGVPNDYRKAEEIILPYFKDFTQRPL